VRVLVAPQEFKGTLSAVAAADAMARGLADCWPDARVDVLPMSDGGPGFIDAVHSAAGGEFYRAMVRDPLGRRVAGRYLVLDDGTAVIEAAEANGLWRLAGEALAPLHAGSEGVGDLLWAALAAGSAAPVRRPHRGRRVIVGLGGSATTDGGAGMARALGARFLAVDGGEPGPGGAELRRLERIEWSRPSWFDGVAVVGATDVTNPLLGPEGAAAVYGPQKGASPADVAVLEAGLARLAEIVLRDLGVDAAAMPGAGAAGGLGFGLVAFLGARLESGFAIVAEVTGLAERIEAADMVLTGEGRYDGQSLSGKTTGRIQALAAAAGKQCVVFCGSAEAGRREDIIELGPGGLRDPAGSLVRAVAAWGKGWKG
jgi:glycerate kinase